MVMIALVHFHRGKQDKRRTFSQGFSDERAVRVKSRKRGRDINRQKHLLGHLSPTWPQEHDCCFLSHHVFIEEAHFLSLCYKFSQKVLWTNTHTQPSTVPCLSDKVCAIVTHDALQPLEWEWLVSQGTCFGSTNISLGGIAGEVWVCRVIPNQENACCGSGFM